MSTAPALMNVSGLVAGYVPEVNILTGLDLKLEAGEIVTVVGPNGAGKSTLLKVMFGILRPREGSVSFNGRRIDALQPHQVVRLGMGYVPQLENVFPSLTVEENLDIPARYLQHADRQRRMDSMYELFPPLKPARHKPAGLLSGGQRQMLAMARALVPEPQVLLLDEPSAGLAPDYVELVFQKIVDIRKSGVTILVVEQNARRALALSDRGYVLELGRNRFEGAGPELLKNETVIELYLGRQKARGDS